MYRSDRKGYTVYTILTVERAFVILNIWILLRFKTFSKALSHRIIRLSEGS